MDLVVQKIEWGSLNEYIAEFTNHHIVFRFPEGNVPKLTEEVWESLKLKFSELSIERPGDFVNIPSGHIWVTEGVVIFTLKFRKPLKRKEYSEFIKANHLE